MVTPMAADDDPQEDVRRILQKRPPEDLPEGAEERLRTRLDREPSAQRARRKPPVSVSKRKTGTKARTTSTRRQR
jgi:hypothetical protein